MKDLKISQAAARTGFSPTTLRYYEAEGLVTPGRSDAGYRTYDERSLASLGFIARAKALGLSLGEITELLELWKQDECEPVQENLRILVESKIGEASMRRDELTAFIEDLQIAIGRLEQHTPDGPCEAGCGCADEAVTAPRNVARFTSPLPDKTRRAVACSLGAEEARSRTKEWAGALASVRQVRSIPDGVLVDLSPDADLGAVLKLIEQERACCPFLRFALRMSTDEVQLEVLGSEDARPVIESLVGAQ